MIKEALKLCLVISTIAAVPACVMYDRNMHHDMKKHNKYSEYGYEKYDYPPYRQQCPANHRAQGWC